MKATKEGGENRNKTVWKADSCPYSVYMFLQLRAKRRVHGVEKGLRLELVLPPPLGRILYILAVHAFSDEFLRLHRSLILFVLCRCLIIAGFLPCLS